MRISGSKVTEINTKFQKEIGYDKLNLNLGFNDETSDSVYKGNWQICRLDELPALLDELQALVKVIEDSTGIILHV